MKKFINHQRPCRKYRFDIVGHKKALKIWWDSPFKVAICWETGFGKKDRIVHWTHLCTIFTVSRWFSWALHLSHQDGSFSLLTCVTLFSWCWPFNPFTTGSPSTAPILCRKRCVCAALWYRLQRSERSGTHSATAWRRTCWRRPMWRSSTLFLPWQRLSLRMPLILFACNFYVCILRHSPTVHFPHRNDLLLVKSVHRSVFLLVWIVMYCLCTRTCSY